MNKIINDKSFESMIDNLFSNEECKKSKEENEEFIINPDLLKELSEKELGIMNISENDEENLECSLLSEESIKIGSEISMMELSFHTAEEYLFNNSLESDSENIWKKFWEWLKGIFLKIREYILIIFKRIQIWLAGDMKAITKWTIDNKADIEKAIIAKGDVIKLKIKKPIRNPLTVSVNDSFINTDFRDAMNKLEKGIVEDSIIDKIEKFLKEYPVDYFEKIVYGDKDVKSDYVTLSEFNKVVKIVDTLTNRSDKIKDKLNDAIKNINTVIKNIKDFINNKNLSNFDKEQAAKIKKFGIYVQKFYSNMASTIYYKFSIQISNIKIAKAFAEKALKANEIENKK